MHHHKAAKQSPQKKKNTKTHTHTHTLTRNTKGLSEEVTPHPSAVTKFRSQHNALSHSKNEELHKHYKTDWEMLRTCNFLDLLLLLLLLCVCMCISLSLCGLGFRVSLCVSLCPEMATEISTQRDSSRDITPKRGREDKSGQARFCARGDGGAMCWVCTHMHTHTHKCIRHKGSKGRIDQKRKGIKQ
jgi:hypothetical protein